VAARRGKSQARRNNGNSGSLPGWAWMVLGIVLTVGVILAAPRFLKGDGEDGFFRPRANPDAQPMVSAAGDEEQGVADPGAAAEVATGEGAQARTNDEPQYDFYDLLPGEEVAMSDAQLAAAAREEQARAQREQQRQAQQAQDTAATDAATTRPQPLPEAGASATTDTPVPARETTAATASPAPAAPAAAADTPYILQAGAFGASGDAEAVKAKIAMLGLNARVESAQIGGKTVYRVRMGPYGTASELAEAKGKLSRGGLPALAIKAK
jgi:cell division protein FtsN